MKYTILALLASVSLLSGCATTERVEDAWGPNAMVRWWENKCDYRSRTAAVGSSDTDRQIRRELYYDCLNSWP